MVYQTLREFVCAYANMGSFREIIINASNNYPYHLFPEDSRKCIDLINECYQLYVDIRNGRKNNE